MSGQNESILNDYSTAKAKKRTKRLKEAKKAKEQTLSDEDINRLADKFLVHMQQTQLYITSDDEENSWEKRRKFNAMANDLRVKTDLGLSSYDINSIITSVIQKIEEDKMKKKREKFLQDVSEGSPESFVYKFLNDYDEYDAMQLFPEDAKNIYEKEINNKCYEFIKSIQEMILFKLEVLNNDIKDINTKKFLDMCK